MRRPSPASIRFNLSTAFAFALFFSFQLGGCGSSHKGSKGSADSATTPEATASSEDGVGESGVSDKMSQCIETKEKTELKAAENKAGDTALAPKKDKKNAPEPTSVKTPGEEKDQEECKTDEAPAAPTPATPNTPAPPAPAAVASLSEGQKIYKAACESCHGVLPGAKNGRTAVQILAASDKGPHKEVKPWPAGKASTLSAELAAASLEMALKE